jgi:hypothetical protein
MTTPVQASSKRETRPHDAPAPEPGGSPERLRWLVRRISGDDGAAFVELFDRVSGPLYDRLRSRLSDPPRAAATITATFVEVWWLAGCHAGPDADVMMWINQIVERRVKRSEPTAAMASIRSRSADLELAALLGRPALPRGLVPPVEPFRPRGARLSCGRTGGATA